MFRRAKTRKVNQVAGVDKGAAGEALQPVVEESVGQEEQPGNVVGAFTYPLFDVALPPELDNAEEGAAVQRQVVVVGADPAGLTLALTLVRQGISVTLLDARRTLASSSRSSTWTGHSLELWSRAAGPAVASALLAAAVPRRRQELLLGGGGAATPQKLTGTIEVEDRMGCMAGPMAVHLQQYYVEKLLYDALLGLPKSEELLDMRWQTSVDEVSVSTEGVVLKASAKVGSKVHSYEMPAAYAVICAAAVKGAVRERTATPQPRGAPAAARTVLTVDLQLPAAAEVAGADRRLYLSADEEGGAVPASAKGGVSWLAVSERRHPDGQLRIDAVLPAGVDLPRAAKTEGAKELARALLGKDANFTVLSCAAHQFRAGPLSKASKQGRLFFCGEALAVLSPFGGVGGNLGVQDAANLAWKLALVLLQGAPQALLETYQLERNAAHLDAAERHASGERILAPTNSSESEIRQVAFALARSGQELGIALLAPAAALPPPARLSASPLVIPDGVGMANVSTAYTGGIAAATGAPFQAESPGPGEIFSDACVEDLELEVNSERSATSSSQPKNSFSRGYLIGHTGAFFTLAVFALSVKDIPWDKLRAVDRSRLQLTLEIVRKVVILLDTSTLERMSDAHVEAVGRAQRLGATLLADRGGSAAAAYDARPGTTILVRPDLCIAARWRYLKPREVHESFMQCTGHLLHTATPTPPPPRISSLPLLSAEGSVTNQLLATLATRLAKAPAERRLPLIATAAVLLAGLVGNSVAVTEALELAFGTAGGAAAAPESDPEGLAVPRVTGLLARRFEAHALDEGRQAALLKSRLDGGVGGGAAAATLAHALAPPLAQALPALLPPDAAVEALSQALSDADIAEEALRHQPPAQGSARLRQRVAADLSRAEGVHISPDAVISAEGPCTVLSLLLDELLAPAPLPSIPQVVPGAEQSVPAPNTSAEEVGVAPSPAPTRELEAPSVAPTEAAESTYKLPTRRWAWPGCKNVATPGELLVVGACPDTWRRALEGRSVRRFDPPRGAGDFALRADDVARQIAAETAVVLLPLFSLAAGLAPSQDELASLGAFIDFEESRREAAARGMSAKDDDAGETAAARRHLTLVVDVSFRRWQMDSAEFDTEDADDAALAAAMPQLRVLSKCRHSIVIGDLFGELSAAPGLQAQFAASLQGGRGGSPASDALGRAVSVLCARAARGEQTGAGTLIQALAAALPQEAGLIESLRRRREVLSEAVESAGLQVIGGRPRVGRFLCASLPEDIDEKEYCQELAQLGVPAEEGSKWGLPGCVRLAFGGNYATLEDSVPHFLTAVRELRLQGRVRPPPEERPPSSPDIVADSADVEAADDDVQHGITPRDGSAPTLSNAADRSDTLGEIAPSNEPHVVSLRVRLDTEAANAASDPDVEALVIGDYVQDGELNDKYRFRRLPVALASSSGAAAEASAEVQVTEKVFLHYDDGSSNSNFVGWWFVASTGDGEPRRLARADPSSADKVASAPAVADGDRWPPTTGWMVSPDGPCSALVVELLGGARDEAVAAVAVAAAAEAEEDEAELDAAALRDAERAGTAAPLAVQLRQGARGIACVVQLSGSITTELIAQAGFEIIVVDSENGPGDVGESAALARSAVGAGAHVIFRLSSAEISHVRRALEAGAEGLLLPRVASVADAEAFATLVRTACKKLHDDETVEWQGLAALDSATAAAAAAAASHGSASRGAGGKEGDRADASAVSMGAPARPLVAVEVDPWCSGSIKVAEAILSVDGIDLVLLDPDTSIEAIAVERGFGGGHAGAGGGPVAVAKNGDEATVGDNDGGGDVSPSSPAVAASETASPTETVIAPPPRTGLASQLRSPALAASRSMVAAASPGLAAAVTAAQQQYWTDFDALPRLAASRQRMVGCSSHARTSPLDLLVAGHSVVVLAADLVLLREGAARHAHEVKAERPQPSGQATVPKLNFATPLESSRARLASGALVSQLRRQRKALGAFLHLGDPLAAELVALAGFEVVVLDHEQGPGDLLNAITLIHAAASAGSHALLRVPGQDPGYLRRALQLGVEGLILPRTESAEQAAAFVDLARRCWPSSGLRGGAGPSSAALRPPASSGAQHLRRRGEELLLKACQVETELGLAAVKDIARIEGVDMVFFAPVELAASAARGQEAGLLLALEAAEVAVKRAGKLLGGMSVPGRSAEQMFRMGYDLVCTTSDVILIRSAAENIVCEAKPPATGPKAGLVQWVASGRVGKLAGDKETLVAKLKKSRKARALGVMSRLGSPLGAELATKEGFDVIVIDHARGPGDLLGAVGIIHAAARAGAHAMIRVPALSHAHLRRALQIGVEGVILPRVEDAEEAQHLVELCLYPTKGYRDDSHVAEARLKNQPFRRMDFSFAPPLVEFYGQRVAEFTRRQGESVLIAAQVDSVKGAQAIREIVKVKGIDMIFVDASRISGADVERVEAAAKDAGLLLGGQLVPGCNVEQMMCLRAARGTPVAPPGGASGVAKKPPLASSPRRVVHSPSASPRPASPARPPPLP
eukprot:TRINITY_DN15047_c0_g6_i3.p1 TRINITY_DN15047_c0_g6~~TRINITY_DN15047_c0_g6_i3.p1  ORF type:complete len:2522 (-),score=530.64 TRINITY_DN15047_c0_g6_i3:66-7631(-)